MLMNSQLYNQRTTLVMSSEFAFLSTTATSA